MKELIAIFSLCVLLAAPSVGSCAEPVAKFAHGGQVSMVVFSPDGKTLLSSGGNDLRLWDLATKQAVRRFAAPGSDVIGVAFSRDGKSVASGHVDTIIRLWDVATGVEVRRFEGSRGPVGALAFSPDGKTLASAAPERVVRLWDLSKGTATLQFPRESEWWVGNLEFTPEGKRLFAGGYDGTIRCWEVDTAKEVQKLAAPQFSCIDLSADGNTVFCNGANNTICLYEVATGQVRQQFGSHGPLDLSVASSPNGRLIAERAKEERVVRLWNRLTGARLSEFESQGAFTFSPDSKLLAAGQGHEVMLWSLADLADNAREKPAEISSQAFEQLFRDLGSPDAVQANQAILTLALAPDQSVARLVERFQRITVEVKPDPEKVAQWIAELDYNKFAVRERASRELAELGGSVEGPLRSALQETKSAEVRLRLRELLKPLSPVGTPTEELVAIRTVEILELIGNADSTRALKTLAQGPPEGRLAQHASQACTRLRTD